MQQLPVGVRKEHSRRFTSNESAVEQTTEITAFPPGPSGTGTTCPSALPPPSLHPPPSSHACVSGHRIHVGNMSGKQRERTGHSGDKCDVENTTMGEKADNDDTVSKLHVCSRLVHVQVDKWRGDTRADSISVLRGSRHDSLTSSLNSR